MRGQEEGWAININKTLGQLSPRASSSTSLMQGLETRLLFFGGGAFGSGFEGTQKALKKRQKSITRLARNSPSGGWAEAKGQEAIPGGLGEASSRGAGVSLVQFPEGLLVPGKGSQGTFLPQESWDCGFIFMLPPARGPVKGSLRACLGINERSAFPCDPG